MASGCDAVLWRSPWLFAAGALLAALALASIGCGDDHAEEFQRTRGGISMGVTALTRVQDDQRPMPPPPAARLDTAEIAAFARWVGAACASDADGCAVQ